MANPVWGRDVVLEMLIDGDYYPILCATECSFSRTPEFIEKTTPASGLFREFALRIEEWDASVTGLTKIDNGASVTFFYMLQTSVRRADQTIRFTFTDDQANQKQLVGNVLIADMDITGAVGDWANCTINFKGTGAFEIDTSIGPTSSNFNVYSDYWIPSNGNNYIDGSSVIHSYSLLATDTVLIVDVEGTQFDLVTGTPTPGSRECKFNTTLLRVIFPADLVFDGTQRVFVMFKRPI